MRWAHSCVAGAERPLDSRAETCESYAGLRLCFGGADTSIQSSVALVHSPAQMSGRVGRSVVGCWRGEVCAQAFDEGEDSEDEDRRSSIRWYSLARAIRYCPGLGVGGRRADPCEHLGISSGDSGRLVAYEAH